MTFNRITPLLAQTTAEGLWCTAIRCSEIEKSGRRFQMVQDFNVFGDLGEVGPSSLLLDTPAGRTCQSQGGGEDAV
jgi:hypothetical protein